MSMEHEAKEISAVVAAELARCENERRRMHEALQATLVSLQRVCDSALPGHAEQASSDVARAVERLMAAARVEARAAAERAEREAGTRIADAQAALGEREAELRAERAELQVTREKLEHELAACARAESAWEDEQRAHERAVSSYRTQLQDAHARLEAARAELSDVRQQLAAGHAERTRLAAALEAVQSAVGLMAADHTPSISGGDRLAGPAQASQVPSGENEAPSAPRAAVPPNRSLKLVSHTPPPSPEPNPELVEYASSLLDQIEAAYWSDLESARSAVEAVDRLTENLRTARDLFARRSDSADCADSPLFRQRLIALLNTRSETSFGRHLAIAAYQLYPIRNQASAGVALRAS